MKKRSYLAMCLVMAMLCACIVTVPAVTVGAEASAFDIAFENSALGTFDSSGESGAIQYWVERNLSGVTKTVKEESGNSYLNLDLTDESIQSVFTFYPVNWSADLSQDKFSEITMRFRMSDMTKSVDETGYPYLAANVSFTDGTSPQSHEMFAVSEDGKTILARDWSGRIYQDGVQKNRQDALYVAETSLADQWITLKMKNDFGTGELTCQLYGEDGNLLTKFVQKFDTAMKGRYLYNINFGLYTYYNGAYRRMNLDLDDIAYKGYTQVPNPFDINFENSALGAFDASGESGAIQYWVNGSAAGTAAKTIKEETENRYLSIDGTDETLTAGSLLYLVNWNVDLTGDKFSKTSFRFRMSDMAKSEDTTGQPYFYVTAGYYSAAEKKLTSPATFAVSEDGKSIIAYDGENRIYQKGQQVKYKESLYTAQTSLADQWLTVSMVHNFDAGEMTCTISGEDGTVLTKFVQEFGTLMTERYLYCLSPYANFTNSGNTYRRNMTLDLDDIAYEVYAEAPAAATYDVTVSYDENQGTVSYNGTAVSDKLTVEEGESVTLQVTPADSYEIDTITVNDAAYTATDNTITLENIYEAQAVEVTFKEKIVTPAIAATGADYLIPGSYTLDGKDYPSVTAFYKMTLPANADLKEYGMYFGDGTNAVRLAAQGKTADHVFGIKVFGEAVEKGSAYTFKGFLQLNGEEEIQGSEGTYTIEE